MRARSRVVNAPRTRVRRAPHMRSRAPRGAGAALVAAVLCCAPVPAARAGASPREAASRAAGYLAARQLSNGAFGAQDQPSDATAEMLASIAAAGGARRTIDAALAYVGAHGPAKARTRAGTAGRIVLALVTAGANPASFAGFDYVAAVESRYDAVTGKYDDGLYADSLAALAEIAARGVLPAQALTYLRVNQCPDGGFAHDTCAQTSDVDTAALVLEVFVRAHVPPSDKARADLVGFLGNARNDDLGWGQHARDGATNANSTALALSALAIAGHPSPPGALLSLQRPDGAFRFRSDATAPNDYATVQAIPGLLGEGYPLTRAPSTRAVPAAPASPQAARPATMSPRAASPAPIAACAPAASPRATTNASGAPTAPGARHHAKLVVVFGDNSEREFCVSFAEDHISGLDLLRRSGLPLVYEDEGGDSVFVCAIRGEGRDYPNESCIPPCPGGRCAFWGYYLFERGAWRFSGLGAAARTVRDGDEDGWRYGEHGGRGGCAPDLVAVPSCAGAPHAIAPLAATRKGSAGGFAAFAAAVGAMSLWAVRNSRRRAR
jgi:hypothetical protein